MNEIAIGCFIASCGFLLVLIIAGEGWFTISLALLMVIVSGYLCNKHLTEKSEE